MIESAASAVCDLVPRSAVRHPLLSSAKHGRLHEFIGLSYEWSGRTYELLGTTTDAASLRRNAERVLDDGKWRTLLAAATRATPAWLSSLMKQPWLVSALLEKFPIPLQSEVEPGLAQRVRRTVRAVMLASIGELRARGTSLDGGLVAPERMFDYLTDRNTPRAMRRAYLDRDVGTVCFAAIQGAQLHRQQPANWLITAAYETFTTTQGAWLDLMAECFAIEVPDDLRMRVNWTEAVAEHRQAQAARLEALRRYDQAEGAPILVMDPGTHRSQ